MMKMNSSLAKGFFAEESHFKEIIFSEFHSRNIKLNVNWGGVSLRENE